MNRQTKICLALLTLAANGAGCAGLRSDSTEQYQTVAPQPHRDAQLAASENQVAIGHLKKGRPKKAELAFQRALLADVTYGPAHNNLGKLYFSQRKYYLAAWEFEYALKLMPDRAEPHYNLGMVHEAAEKLEEAIDFYSAAMAIEPNNPIYIGNLVRAQIRRGGDHGEIHLLLKELIFHDDRPPWVAWAQEQLATTYPSATMEAQATDSDPPEDEEQLTEANARAVDDTTSTKTNQSEMTGHSETQHDHWDAAQPNSISAPDHPPLPAAGFSDFQ